MPRTLDVAKYSRELSEIAVVRFKITKKIYFIFSLYSVKPTSGVFLLYLSNIYVCMITYYGGYFGTVPNLTIPKLTLKLEIGKNRPRI